MKKVIAFIRARGYSRHSVSDQDIRRAYWRNAKQRFGIGANPEYTVLEYLRINGLIQR